jgi:hypothetical protein
MSMTSLGSGDGIDTFLVQPFAFAQCKEFGGPGSRRGSLFAAANDVANDTAWTVDGFAEENQCRPASTAARDPVGCEL